MLKCTSCTTSFPLFKRVCPVCGEHDSFVPDITPLLLEYRKDSKPIEPQYEIRSYTFGMLEMDSLVPPGPTTGSTYMFLAPPGLGKTTLLLQFAASFVRQNLSVLFASLEMGKPGIDSMISRYGLEDSRPDFMYEGDFRAIAEVVRERQIKVLILDSLQTLHDGRNQRPTYREQTANSLSIRELSKTYGTIICAVSQVNKDHTASGPMATLHNFDTVFEMRKGQSDEVIISANEKNRQSFGARSRGVLRKTPAGLVPKEEPETGNLLRHTEKFITGLAACPVLRAGDVSVDEFTAVKAPGSESLAIHGAPSSMTAFLSGVLSQIFPGLQLGYLVRPNRNEKTDRAADLAVVLTVISRHFKVPLPVDVAFFGSLDAYGRLLSVPEQAFRTERAISQGYSRVIGPRRLGSETPTWTECDDVLAVFQELGLSIK